MRTILNLALERSNDRLELFHISGSKNLEGIWHPKLPHGSNEQNGNKVTINTKVKRIATDIDTLKEEVLPPRISVSPDLNGCFAGIYPNHHKGLEEAQATEFFQYVYSPVLKGSGIKLITPEFLTSQEKVHDAYLTKEYLILDDVMMRLVGEVTFDVRDLKSEPYHPFNNRKYPEFTITGLDAPFKFKRY